MDFNLAQVSEAIAEAIPEREMMVFRERRLRYGEVRDRTRRLANFLREQGFGAHRERAALANWESGQDHLALYLYNGNEYVEGMLGAYKARVAPFNVNYRYVEDELRYLLADSKARGIVYHAEFAPKLAGIRDALPELELLVQVADESGNELLPGAIEYESALSQASPERPDCEWSPDDLYLLYTGGTTGMPKAVAWRQADIYVAALGGRKLDRSEYASLEEIVEAARGEAATLMPTPPFMHGAAHWTGFSAFHGGNTVAIQNDPKRLDPEDVLTTAAREKVAVMVIVGDAFARPLLDELRRKPYDLGALRVLGSGGAPLNAQLKDELFEVLPDVMINDGVGASETGAQALNVSTRHAKATSGTFSLLAGACVLSGDLSRVLEPGDEEIGWFAQQGRVPLGYLGDEAKTERTFPTVDATRYAVPGDRAKLRPDGTLELLGRDSVTINSGGEKIFAEEVEDAVKRHPDVYDAVVCGRPSERWGNEVVAVVRLREGAEPDEASLREHCGRSLARYKLPKSFVFRDVIQRSPSGKADYRWARAQAEAER